MLKQVLGVNDLNSPGFLIEICPNGNLPVKKMQFYSIFKQDIMLKICGGGVVSALLSDPRGV